MILVRSRGVEFRLFADDIKTYCEVSDSLEESSLLQRASDGVLRWSQENGVELSVPKCAVIKTKADPVVYQLADIIIPEVTSIRDLGVTVTPDLKFRKHIIQVATSAATICNLIHRCFTIRRPDFYVNLYLTLVVPRITYCASVWAPSLLCDIKLLDAVRDKFIRRVADHCDVPRSTVTVPANKDLFEDADCRALRRLSVSDDLDKFFNVSINTRRSGIHLKTKCVAPDNVVNNLFSWRVARSKPTLTRPFIVNKAT